MRSITKRTVAFTAAVAGFALIGSGCHATKANDTASSAASSAASAMSSAASSATSAVSSAVAGAVTTIPGANGTPYTVEGPILAKFQSLTDAQKKDLGAPFDNEKKTLNGTGSYQQFDGGVLIYKTLSLIHI